MDYKQGDHQEIFDYVVVGAGFAGAFCAGQLAERGDRVAIIDKARGTGGRLSSKRLTLNDQQIGFDLGAQSFEVSNRQFAAYLKGRDDVIVDEAESISFAYGVPRNSGFARGALGTAEPFFGQRVLEVRFEVGVWNVLMESSGVRSTLRARNCVLATPPKQAAQLLGEQHSLFGKLDSVGHEAQWVAMFGMERGSEPASALRLLSESSSWQSDIIQAIAFDHDKQGRGSLEELEVVVVHAQPSWTIKQVDVAPEIIAGMLLEELALLLGKTQQALAEVILVKHVHRWLYARPEAAQRLKEACLRSADENLLICGDYFTVDSEFGVESAFLSAHALLGKEAERPVDDARIA